MFSNQLILLLFKIGFYGQKHMQRSNRKGKMMLTFFLFTSL